MNQAMRDTLKKKRKDLRPAFLRRKSSRQQSLPQDDGEDSLSSASTTQSVAPVMIESSALVLRPKTEEIVLPRTRKIALYQTPRSLPEAVASLVQSTHRVLQSEEMRDVVAASQAVVVQSTKLVVHAATLPVRLPVELCTNLSMAVLSSSLNIAQQATKTISGQPRVVEEKKADNEGLIPSAFALPGLIFGMAGQVVLSVVSPALIGEKKKLDDQDYLDRLRLDYGMETTMEEIEQEVRAIQEEEVVVVIEPTAAKSVYLLRVNEAEIYEDSEPVYYIDLGLPENRTISLAALDQLVSRTMSFLANLEHVKMASPEYSTTSPSTEIQWNAEGNTKRYLKKFSMNLLRNETLVWSGKFKHSVGDRGHGRKHPVFLARGAIDMSPRETMELLWSNERASEYNNFNLGRSTILSVDHEDADAAILAQSADSATKIIKSEMRVPFVGITVSAVCLMHVRKLSAPDSGYVIFSRSLDKGNTGNCKFGDTASVERTKNEILWGCNVLRGVPGEPGLTDIISLSQVGSNVPGFLAQKIGLLGISDFFRNVRGVATRNTRDIECQSTTSSAGESSQPSTAASSESAQSLPQTAEAATELPVASDTTTNASPERNPLLTGPPLPQVENVTLHI